VGGAPRTGWSGIDAQALQRHDRGVPRHQHASRPPGRAGARLHPVADGADLGAPWLYVGEGEQLAGQTKKDWEASATLGGPIVKEKLWFFGAFDYLRGSSLPPRWPLKSESWGHYADAKLSALEQLLVSMGLAEAPPPPIAYAGTPGTRVWVDINSALYYCPGADPYGKTPKGKFLTQREAQDEQFQPARGQPCD